MQRRLAVNSAARRVALGLLFAVPGLLAPWTPPALVMFAIGGAIALQAALALRVLLRTPTNAFALAASATTLRIPSMLTGRRTAMALQDVESIEVRERRTKRGTSGFVVIGRRSRLAVSVWSGAFDAPDAFVRLVDYCDSLAPDVNVTRSEKEGWLFLLLASMLVALHLAREVAPGADGLESLVLWGAAHRDLVLGGDWYRLVTAGFAHADWLHLCSNMVLLAILLPQFELKLGSLRMLVLFVVCNIGAGICAVTFSEKFVVGASGALYGVGGCLCVLAIVRQDLVPIRLRATLPRWYLFGLIALDTAIGIAVPVISFSMHAGGFVTGALLGAYWYRADVARAWQAFMLRRRFVPAATPTSEAGSAAGAPAAAGTAAEDARRRA
jgi:membrane associated rhomboid family serine protease